MLPHALLILVYIFFFSPLASLEGHEFVSLITSDEFYHSEEGNKIMDPTTYPQEILNFLNDENKFITQIIDQYDVLLECGCADASRSLAICKKHRQYVGIDINKSHIKKSKIYFFNNDIQVFARTMVMDLHTLTKETFPIESDKKSLIMIPFNLIGNLENISNIFQNLVDIGSDFSVSSYYINRTAFKARKKYYKACGCKVDYSMEIEGDLFHSPEGLKSIGFRPLYLEGIIKSALHKKHKKAKFCYCDLGKIGYLIYVSDIK